MIHDLSSALRSLRRHPVFTSLVVLSLGLGIGATVLVFSVAETVLFRPLPYPDPDRLVDISHKIVGGQTLTSSRLDIPDYRSETQLFEDVGARRYLTVDVALVVGAEAYPATMLQVSANYFSVLGVQAALGRTFRPEDAEPSSAPEGEEAQWYPPLVITHQLWETVLGADESLVGGTVNIQGQPIRLLGVLKPDFEFLHERPHRWVQGTETDLFIPYPSSFFTAPGPRGGQGTRGLWPLARLKPGVSYEEAQAGLDVLTTRFHQAVPGYAEEELRLELAPLQEYLAEGSRPIVWVLLGGVLFLMLLICGNVANLLLVRGRLRLGEDAVRRAIGSAQARLVRQKLMETLLLALFGGVVGIGLGWVAVRVFEVFAPRTVPLLNRVELSGISALLGIGVGIIFAVGFGLIPALRLAGQPLAGVLGSDAPGRAGRGRAHAMNALVIGELVIAMVLLTGAGIMAQTLLAMTRASLGYDPENVVTFSIMDIGDSYEGREGRTTFFGDLRGRFEALPEVEVFARSGQLPLSGGGENTFFGWDRESYDRSNIRVHLIWVTHDYFRAMGTRILTGRPFTEAETTDSTGSVIVAEDLARIAWPGQDPVGKEVIFGGPPWVGQVVGVAETLHMREGGQEYYPGLYVAEGTVSPGAAESVVLRGSFGTRETEPIIRGTLGSIGPGIIPYEVEKLADRVAMYRAPTRFVVVALAAFAAVALIVAAVGLFSVISYAVQSRAGELGIRIALGASKREIMLMVFRQGAILSGLGLGGGIVLAVFLTRFMESVFFGLTSADPLLLLGTAAILGVISLLACCAPARWACQVDPIALMRSE